MELTDSLKALFSDTARTLKGSARRVFMARTVKELGPGGNGKRNAILAGAASSFVKERANSKVASPSRTTSLRAAASVPKTISPICLPISPPLSTARAKLTPNSAPRGCIPASVPPKSGAN